MILAIDVYYKDDEAHCVGVIFNWPDMHVHEIIKGIRSPIDGYIPGKFYRRELPCLLQIVSHVDLTTIEAIIVDAHVYLDNALAYGLGGRLWEALNKKIAVIGVAKTTFHNNDQTTIPVIRGEGRKPLYVSAIGMDTTDAAAHIKSMHGKHRIPTILKKLDQLTRA